MCMCWLPVSLQAAPSARRPSGSTSRSSLACRATLTNCEPIGWRGCGRRSEGTSARRCADWLTSVPRSHMLWSYLWLVGCVSGQSMVEQFEWGTEDGHRWADWQGLSIHSSVSPHSCVCVFSCLSVYSLTCLSIHWTVRPFSCPSIRHGALTALMVYFILKKKVKVSVTATTVLHR